MTDGVHAGPQGNGRRSSEVESGHVLVVRPIAAGNLHFAEEWAALPERIDLSPEAPTYSTPLAEGEPEGAVPHSPLWAMKDRRHEQWHHPLGHAERVRQAIGDGDETVYVIDDGVHHRMLGRQIGGSPDGCIYSLVGRITRRTHEALVDGSIDGRHAFLAAHELGVDGTVEEPAGAHVANLFDVAYYDRPEDVPAEYLPPSPFIDFAEPLPTADH